MTTPVDIVLIAAAFAGGGTLGTCLALRQPLRDFAAGRYVFTASIRLGPAAGGETADRKTSDVPAAVQGRSPFARENWKGQPRVRGQFASTKPSGQEEAA